MVRTLCFYSPGCVLGTKIPQASLDSTPLKQSHKQTSSDCWAPSLEFLIHRTGVELRIYISHLFPGNADGCCRSRDHVLRTAASKSVRAGLEGCISPRESYRNDPSQ